MHSIAFHASQKHYQSSAIITSFLRGNVDIVFELAGYDWGGYAIQHNQGLHHRSMSGLFPHNSRNAKADPSYPNYPSIASNPSRPTISKLEAPPANAIGPPTDHKPRLCPRCNQTLAVTTARGATPHLAEETANTSYQLSTAALTYRGLRFSAR